MSKLVRHYSILFGIAFLGMFLLPDIAKWVILVIALLSAIANYAVAYFKGYVLFGVCNKGRNTPDWVHPFSVMVLAIGFTTITISMQLYTMWTIGALLWAYLSFVSNLNHYYKWHTGFGGEDESWFRFKRNIWLADIMSLATFIFEGSALVTIGIHLFA